MATQHSMLTRAKQETFNHTTLHKSAIAQKAPVSVLSDDSIKKNFNLLTEDHRSTILLLEQVESGVKVEQNVEEQPDLQLIVENISDGQTEVILEAYTEESDPNSIGWLQTAVVDDGHGTSTKTLSALEAGGHVYYQYQVTADGEQTQDDDVREGSSSKEDGEAVACEMCTLTFPTPAQLTRHIMSTHAGKRPFVCEFCGHSFCDRLSMDKHTLLHMVMDGEKYICCYCGDLFTSNDIKDHLAVHKDNKRKSVRSASEDSDDSTDAKYSLIGTTDENVENLIEIDPQTNQRKCKVCDKVFTEKSNIRRHMQMHSGERPFECELCGKKFADKHNWSHHMGVHSGVMKFTCEECGKQFPESKQFKKHMLIHTTRETHECPLCKKTFKFAQGLKNHLNIHAGLRPYLCDLCGKGFRNKAALRYHSMIHTGESVHSCEMCGKGFIQLKALREHIMVRHSNDRPYICNYCGKGFPSNATLKVHLNCHNDQREMFRCDTCCKSFTTAGSLKVHNRLHSGELAFECEVCGERFTTTAKRRLHMFEHSGKPYGCDLCDKRFITSKEKDIHLLTHTGQKPHMCMICQKGFIRMHHLKRHQLIHQK